MDLDELRSVRRTERQKDSLQHLRDSFYEDVAAYIAERKAERRRAAEAADDPFGDPEVGRLSDEIGTAEDVVEAIYERRVGKVVKLASFAAADMSADKSGLTVEERELFEDLVERIRQNRRTVLDTLAGEGAEGSGVEIDVDAAASTSADAGAESTGGAGNAAGVDAPGVNAEASGPEPGPSPGTDTATPEAGMTDGSSASNGPPTSDDSSARGDHPASNGPPTSDDSPAPGDHPASDGPPAPDDVLAAAMGEEGAPPSSADAGSAGDASDPVTGDDADPAPSEAAVDSGEPADRKRDVPVVDGAETDGGDAAVTAGDVAESVPAAASQSRDAADAARAAGAGAADETADAGEDRVTLRITADVGRIYGVDEREYDLESEDVVRLPATNAGPLVERGAAERLE